MLESKCVKWQQSNKQPLWYIYMAWNNPLVYLYGMKHPLKVFLNDLFRPLWLLKCMNFSKCYFVNYLLNHCIGSTHDPLKRFVNYSRLFCWFKYIYLHVNKYHISKNLMFLTLVSYHTFIFINSWFFSDKTRSFQVDPTSTYWTQHTNRKVVASFYVLFLVYFL